MAELRVGDKAPGFTLPRDGGASLSLSDFAGKPVVLYFYPKDNTESCTIEAVSFTALAGEFEKAGAAVIGVSPDSVKKHNNFVKKHALGIMLASDEERSVIEAYDVWKEKSMYGKAYMGVERTTFLIAPDGTVARIWNKVKVNGHAEDVLDAVKALTK